MTDGSETQPKTSICGFDEDTILLRDRNLVDEVIGHYSFTAAFLLQALGKEPSSKQIELMDVVLVTIMEHGLVPSVVASRLTFHGAPESLQGAVAAGLLGVGDRYAGTAALCGEVLQALIDAESCEAAAAQRVAEYRSLKRPVPGFGHPIHTGRDPRVEKLLSYVDAEGKPVQAARALEAALSEALGRPLVMNVSTALAVLMFDIGLPVTAMRGVVVLARCAGLVGHLLEEAEQPAGDALWRGAEAAVTYRQD